LPNVGPYIYDVSISGFTRSSIYIYDISSLRVKSANLQHNNRTAPRQDKDRQLHEVLYTS